jgi:signal transduction histidine kinase
MRPSPARSLRFITEAGGADGFDEKSLSYILERPKPCPLPFIPSELYWNALILDEDWPAFLLAFRRGLAGGTPFSINCRIRDRESRSRRVTVSGAAVPGADGAPGFVEGHIYEQNVAMVCTGCREIIAQGERQAKEFSKNILSVLSHDIRSPLIGVIGALQMMRRFGLDERQEELARAASHSCEQILELAKNLLDFARIDSGKDSLSPRGTNLAAVADSVASLHMEQTLTTGVFLDLEKDPGFPESLFCDEVKVRQIMGNLISNAFKFTPRGSVRITLTYAPRPDGRITVILEVRDTGVGFDPSRTRYMFDQFAQLCHGQTLGRSGGAGLGLTIVKGLVDLFGGAICAESGEGGGSSFVVSFPAETAGR